MDFNLLLEKIKQELIKEFKNEQLVNDAFSSANIVLCDNLYEYLINNNLILDIAKIYKDTLNTIVGMYFSVPTVSYKDNKYNVDKVKRYVLISDFDINNRYSVASLVHELCHLVKSYNNEYTINKNLLINHSGLITKTYKLNSDLSSVLLGNNNVGFEEGLNTYLEEKIMNRLGYYRYISLNYLGCNNIARDLIKSFNIYEAVKRAQINHDIDYLKYNFGNIFDKLVDLFDEVYLLDSDLLFNKDKEDKNKKIDELISFVDDNYYPIKDNISKQLKKGR